MLVNLDVVCVQCAAGCQSQWTKSLKNQGQKNPEIKMLNQFDEIFLEDIYQFKYRSKTKFNEILFHKFFFVFALFLDFLAHFASGGVKWSGHVMATPLWLHDMVSII